MRLKLPHVRRIPLALLCILLLAMLLRLVWLDKVPSGITDDELGFVLNAKAVFLTGSDIKGGWSPLSLTPVTGEFPQAELPYLLIAPVIGLLPLSLFTAKLPYAIISTLLVGVVALITAKLIGRKEAIVAGLVAALNPWSIFFGRTAYEAPVAIFFYLLAFLLLLQVKGWKILFAFIPLFLGFYSYMGTKLILLPYAALVIFYSWYVRNQKHYGKQYLVLFLLCVSLVGSFAIAVRGQSTAARLSELATPFQPRIAKTVDTERRLTIQTPLTPLFANKAVVWGKDALSKYLSVFATPLLFITGEGRSTFSLWYHGYFYYLDFFFFLIGYASLFARKRPVFLLLTGLMLIAPLPTVASSVETGFAALRAALLFPLFMLIIAVGISAVVFWFPRPAWRRAAATILAGLFVLQLGNFLNTYVFRYPVYASEAYNFSSRLLSRYVSLAAAQGKRVIVISNTPEINFRHYLFDTNSYSSQTVQTVKQAMQKKAYSLKTVSFIPCRIGMQLPEQTIVIANATERCKVLDFAKKDQLLIIPQLADAAAMYAIKYDTVCQGYRLPPYPTALTVSDFQIETLPEKRFCETFILRYQ